MCYFLNIVDCIKYTFNYIFTIVIIRLLNKISNVKIKISKNSANSVVWYFFYAIDTNYLYQFKAFNIKYVTLIMPYQLYKE